MPIIHSQIEGQAQVSDGKASKLVSLPSHAALQLRGPVLQVTVTIEQSAGKALVALGKTVPAPKTGFALIDTGASNTCVDDKAAKELGLPVIDVGMMQSANEKKPCNIYPIQITVAGAPIVISCPRALAADLASQGLLLLIGRDVLQNCNLFYNGPAGQFTLSM